MTVSRFSLQRWLGILVNEFTGLAMTRERERGTFENLLSTPALPVQVMTGKIVPYILIGVIQVTLALAAALWIFDVPMLGSPTAT